MIYEDNIKKTRTRKNGFMPLRCKCGSVRLEAEMAGGDPDSEGYHDWVWISCRKCGKGLYYNGA